MADSEVAGRDWSSAELDLIVADYFAMLKAEQAGETVRKTEHRRALKEHLHRTDGSIEFKQQNISAVLTELGLPRIRGYVPAWNFQGAIAAAIGRYLEMKPDPVPLTIKPLTGFSELPSLFVGPPPTRPPIGAKARTVLERVARKFDPALRDQMNRALGQAGEELIETSLERYGGSQRKTAMALGTISAPMIHRVMNDGSRSRRPAAAVRRRSISPETKMKLPKSVPTLSDCIGSTTFRASPDSSL